MIHSTFLIDLRKEASTKLMFYPPHQDYTWSFDDIMVFAFSSRQAGMSGAFAVETWGSLLGAHRPSVSCRLQWWAETLFRFLCWIWSGITSSEWLAVWFWITASFKGCGSHSQGEDSVSETKCVASTLDLCHSKMEVSTGGCSEIGTLAPEESGGWSLGSKAGSFRSTSRLFLL